MSRRILPASAWTAMIVVLCWIPGRWLGHEGGGNQLDKLVHAGLFAGFAWLWARVATPSRRTARIVAAGLLLAFLTEAGQAHPLVGRDPDPFDVLADAFGLGVGLGVFRLGGRTPEPSESELASDAD